MNLRAALALVIVAACGGDDGKKALLPVDGPADTPNPQHHHFVIDSMRVPTTNTEATELAVDLNDDSYVDNQLGRVFAKLSTLGLSAQVGTRIAIDRGEVITLLDVGSMSWVNPPVARVTVRGGHDPIPSPCDVGDTSCRRHLAGTGTFSPEPLGLLDGALWGSGGAGVIDVEQAERYQEIVIKLALPDSTPIVFPLIGARIRLSMAADDVIGSIVIAGGVQLGLNDHGGPLVAGVHESADAAVLRDCAALSSPPLCGCANGSAGQLVVAAFDSQPPYCDIAQYEVEGSDFMRTVYAPDIMINTLHTISLGVSGTAVSANFTSEP